MKKTDKINYREKSIDELQKLLIEASKKIVENKAKLATGGLKDTSVFKKLRYQIAYLSTLIHQKQNESR